MKKNGKKVAVIALLAVVAVGSYFISGTYAKYSRALSGSDTATVAKFSVSATGLNKEQNATINLFDTLKEEDTTTAEEHVLATKIAPGTGGQFTTTLTNDSEVDVEAVITLSETSNTSNIPIEYSFNGTDWKSVGDATTTVKLDYVGKTDAVTSKPVTIYWRWAFDKNTIDADNALGEATDLPSIETKVTATFTQVD